MEDSTLTTSLQHLSRQGFITMKSSFFHKVVLATASTTFGLTVCSSLSVAAATVTYDFKFDPSNNQPLITGSFSYDDSLVKYYPVDYRNPGYNNGSFLPIPGHPELLPCYLFSPTASFPSYCVSGGSSIRLTDFLINVSGNTFRKSNAQSFNLTWERDVPLSHGGYTYNSVTGFFGTATWNNPYLSLAFYYPPFGGTEGFFSTDINNPVGYFQGNSLGSLSLTLRNIEPTSVPEGQQELALLGLGILGFASLLKKKVSSSQHS